MAEATGASAARERVRAFALGLPGAVEEFPWGESVIKVNKKVFVFLGTDDGGVDDSGVGDGGADDRGAGGHGSTPGITVKLTDLEAHAHALTTPGAEPAGYGLGKAGWVRIPLAGQSAPAAELLCDWTEESYRVIAPKKLIAELDGG